MPVHREPVDDRPRHDGPHPLDGRQLRHGRRDDPVQRTELARQRLSGRRAHVADRQRDEQPPQGPVAGCLDARKQVGHAEVGETLDLVELLGREVEDIRFVAQATGLQQRDPRLVAEAVDVERTPGGKVKHPFTQLRRTRPRVRAPGVGLTLGADERRGALGALLRHDEHTFAAVAQGDDRADDLGDDVTRPPCDDRVTDEHALAPDLVGVVQGRHADGHPTHPHGREHREGRDPAGTPDIDRDVTQRRRHLFGRVLVGDGPARRLRGGAQPPLQAQVVDLDDDAVDLVLDVVAMLPPALDESLHRLDRRLHLEEPGNRQPPATETLVGLRLRGRGEVAMRPQPVQHHGQGPVRRHPRIFLPQRPRRRVARVGEGGLAALDQPSVQILKCRHR